MNRSLARHHTTTLCLVTAVILIGYYQVSSHHFVWDTIPFVLENPWLYPLTPGNLLAILTEAHHANWQPVVWLSHSLDFYLFGDDAGAHHLVNVALHAVNTMLVYFLARRLVVLRGNWPDHLATAIAALTAILFAIHPQHVESVAWVVERKDVLYSVFTLGCFISYLRQHGAEQGSPALTFTLFCLAIASKPMAIMVPSILVLFDLYPLQRASFTPASLARAVVAKWHYLAVAIAVLVVTLNTQSMAMADTTHLPVWARVANTVDNTWFYVAHYIAPVSLSPFYPYPQDAALLASPRFWGAGALFILATTTAGIVAWRRGSRALLVMWLYYLATLLPVSGLVHVGPAKATDHYVYLATLPIAFATAIGVIAFWRWAKRARAVTLAITIGYVAFLTAITHQQVRYWANPLTLWTRVEQMYPDSAFAHRNLAAAYYQVGDIDAALQHAERSLALGGPVEAYVREMRAAAGR